MTTIRIGALLLALFTVPLFAEAGTIYYWTDENGVRHFTNKGRPEGVEDVGKRPEEIRPPIRDQDAGASPGAVQTEEQAEEEARDRGKNDPTAQQIEQERDRLQEEIDKIDRLAIGVSFSQGMKDNRMRPYKEQLAILNDDPGKYFEMKKRGVFDN
jgi:hypothetical protein